MDYTPLLLVLFEQLIVPAAAALIGAFGAWAATKLPGPLRDWLQSATHARDVELLLGALGRGALAIARHVLDGKAAPAARNGAPAAAAQPPPPPLTAATAADMVVDYARKALPETLAKLAPSEDALRTMARAAVERALKDAAR